MDHPTPTDSPLLTLAEAAAAIRKSEGTLRRLIHSRELGAHRIGGRLAVSRADLDAYLTSRRIG